MKTMKRYLSFLLLLLAFGAQAQFQQGAPGSGTAPAGASVAQGTGRISGIIVDSTAGKAVEFASVAIYNKATGKPVDGTSADDKGKFALSKVPAGSYKMLISFLGFQTKTIDNLEVADGKSLDLGTVKLVSTAKTLEEVTVTGQKALIEEKVDRLVYNADKDIAAKGGDASDILRKVPMLTVDLDGNVSLRGSSNIRVLINNKPSTIVASSVADALKQIPADQIQTVEVITSPSAKYDAEGSGGIINIITKKNSLQGLNLNVDTGAGNRGAMLGLNGNYRKGKMGISLGGFGRANYNTPTKSSLEQTSLVNGNTIKTSQTGTGNSNGMFGRYNLGFDYDISKNQSLTAGVRYGLRNMNQTQDYLTQIYTNAVAGSASNRNVDTKNHSNTIDANVDYLRTFKPQQEWSISTLYSRNDLTNNFDANILESGSLAGRQRNLNGNVNQEFTLQTDYQTPIKKNQMIEFGAKGILRKVNSDYQYLVAGPTGGYSPQENNPSGTLDYNQNIAAAYTAYTYTTANKYTLKAGLRYEYTTISATANHTEINIPNYGNLVPSINLSKQLKGATLKLAYNRRIQRPGIQQLNPNFNTANPQNISMGNPYLNPELTDNVELGLSKNIGKTFFNVAFFGRFTDNLITQVRTPIDTLAGSILTTYQNIGSEHAFGTNIFANIALTPKISWNLFSNILHTTLQGKTTGVDGTSIDAKNSGVNVDFGSMLSAQLKNGWGIQGFGMMRGPQVQLQGRMGGFGFYSVGVRKDLANKKGSIGIAAENFLTSNIRIHTELTSPQFTQVSNMYMYNRGIRLTFTYKIGKMSMEPSRKKTKSVNNDDVKEGGDQNQQQQGGQQSGGGRSR
ncbi:TonB-dependent receptor domain-containing protein [Siphonobacter aquaeclarae]|nr:TonB-dependent receptor [Siphonobacter aquaeclarae]